MHAFLYEHQSRFALFQVNNIAASVLFNIRKGNGCI